MWEHPSVCLLGGDLSPKGDSPKPLVTKKRGLFFISVSPRAPSLGGDLCFDSQLSCPKIFFSQGQQEKRRPPVGGRGRILRFSPPPQNPKPRGGRKSRQIVASPRGSGKGRWGVASCLAAAPQGESPRRSSPLLGPTPRLKPRTEKIPGQFLNAPKGNLQT